MKLYSDASERVVKAIALADRIVEALYVLRDLGVIDQATYCTDAARWLGVKVDLQTKISWHREAELTRRRIAKLFADPVFRPEANSYPADDVTYTVDGPQPCPDHSLSQLGCAECTVNRAAYYVSLETELETGE